MRYLEPIAETSYLSAVNAAQYRKIMRIFFLEYEKMHFQLYKEDVLEKLRAEAGYESYSIDQLKLDLEALVTGKILRHCRIQGGFTRLQIIRTSSSVIPCLNMRWKLNV